MHTAEAFLFLEDSTGLLLSPSIGSTIILVVLTPLHFSGIHPIHAMGFANYVFLCVLTCSDSLIQVQ